MIIFNSAHSVQRTANSIAHELSHVLLEHEPGGVLDDGVRRFPADDETEADLAGRHALSAAYRSASSLARVRVATVPPYET